MHPHSDELKVKRAKVYISIGENSKALRLLESLTHNKDYEATLLRIEALTRLDRDKEALQIAKNLASTEQDDLDNICLDIAFIYISQLNFETALFFLKSGDKYFAKNVDLLFELAFCYEQMLYTDKAVETYHRIIDIDPYTSEAWFNIGQIHFNNQKFVEALEAYEFALTINPEDSLTCLQKAHSLFQIEKYSDAVETYQEYVSITEASAATDVFIGECYEKMEMYDAAITCYQQAIEKEPENYDALTGVAICLLEKDDFTNSLKYTQRAITINEEAPDAWVYLAEGLVGIDDMDNALIAYLKSISLEPNQPDTLMAIANICMDKYEFKTALEYYLTAYDLDKNLEFVELFIAIAFYKTNNITSAKLYLKKAIALKLDASKMFFEICPDANQNELIDF